MRRAWMVVVVVSRGSSRTVEIVQAYFRDGPSETERKYRISNCDNYKNFIVSQ